MYGVHWIFMDIYGFIHEYLLSVLPTVEHRGMSSGAQRNVKLFIAANSIQ